MFDRNGTRILLPFFIIFASFIANTHAYSIVDFGGVANVSSNDAALTNTNALTQTILAANSSQTDRVALIPHKQFFYIFALQLSNIFNVTIKIQGGLVISDNITEWSTQTATNSIYFTNSHYITIEGGGEVDGQGYDWWWYVFITGKDYRPNMIYFNECTNILMQHLTLKNSPKYHVYLHDVKDVIVRKIDIIVNVEKQKEIYRHFNALDEFGIPTFPLNTDGIDPAGVNVLIEDCNILNYDDAVAVKPMTTAGVYSSCTSNIIVRNVNVSFGVGMSIGSVPPNTAVNCIRNVLISNVNFHHPIKAIYIKTNPGTAGSGIIDNITYQNITGVGSLWYPIWIGPQQQHQPHEEGTGCSFFYPIIPHCPTQPLVTVSNIYLINVKFKLGVFLPGVVLCDETQPCSNIQFIDVKNHGEFIVQSDYVCENVVNLLSSSSVPSLICNNTATTLSSPLDSIVESPEPIPPWDHSPTLHYLLSILSDAFRNH